jgi:hypothetical protein
MLGMSTGAILGNISTLTLIIADNLTTLSITMEYGVCIDLLVTIPQVIMASIIILTSVTTTDHRKVHL